MYNELQLSSRINYVFDSKMDFVETAVNVKQAILLEKITV
jgi:hypothetical protein